MNNTWACCGDFSRWGILGYGGGPGSISIIQVVTVESNHWMTNQQFAEILAVGNALPGPIVTKMAATIGYQVGGVGGEGAALLGVVLPSLVLPSLVLPSLVLMLGLYRVMLVFKSNPYVAGLI